MGEKTCLITGASGGIGKAVALQLAAEGWRLVLHYNSNKEAVQELLHQLPDKCIMDVMKQDLSQHDGAHMLMERLHFNIDAFVNAGGSSLFGMLQDAKSEEMDQMLNLHIKAPWIIAKHVLPHMTKQQNGQIILISSVWGEVGASHEVLYSTVKGAQNSFVKALAKEVGSSGVQVNAVSPGYIDTNMNHHFSNDEVESVIQSIPANRPGTVEEVANFVSFLLSGRSSYINGQVLGINGGWY
ncbi:elongation factor P 5-aminopentanone reductase [Salirhabdus salicampi]|uniref:elongation factor P 5-aminopentanone reductase n=1 Tax=Salirhabdus salicampi TaxID=476102 RepID=UPI0020C397D8|nr:SDR family oxidoreductase [Salirhabdus salicampi]MCP8616458.1 SDR family oxidoreductase [Salirhabdus salicampi]